MKISSWNSYLEEKNGTAWISETEAVLSILMVALSSLDVCVYPVCDESLQRHGLVFFPEDRNTGLGKLHALPPVDTHTCSLSAAAGSLRREGKRRGRGCCSTPLTCRTCQSCAGVSSWTSLWWDWPYGSASEWERVHVLAHTPWCSTPPRYVRFLSMSVRSGRERVSGV